MKNEKILVLAPHTDDGELGCGATIAKYLREGKQVYYVAFSSCEDSISEGFQKDTLKKELLDATNVLGIPQQNVIIFNYKVRVFAQHRQEILDNMIILNKNIGPDIVFIPSIKDIHQDHYTIAIEGLRAFKKTTILSYEVPWNNFSFNNQVFSIVEEQDVAKKVSAIKCYNSQSTRPYTSEEFIRAVMITHGVQIGSRFAEVFESQRLII